MQNSVFYMSICVAQFPHLYSTFQILLKVTEKCLPFKTLILFREAVRQTWPCNFTIKSFIYHLLAFVKRFRAAISPEIPS